MAYFKLRFVLALMRCGWGIALFDRLRKRKFELEFRSHAEAIISGDFPEIVTEIEEILLSTSISVEDLVRSGGGEAVTTQNLRRAFAAKTWNKHVFTIKKLIDGREAESISHQMDHVRTCANGVIALEIEWNNKDPFFDRDLENFKRLHTEGAISVGIILTRGSTLQDSLRDLVRAFAKKYEITSFAELRKHGVKNPTERQESAVTQRTAKGVPFSDAWTDAFCSDKFGQATTHWRKLDDRIRRGVGNPCPLVLIGLPAAVIKI
ncbi:MAG: BglII/BstYI family type II restriction endonuclease [Alphaproteobacteria bacterium]